MRLAAFLTVVAAQLADIGSSLYAEAHGGVEANPLFKSPGQMIAAKVLTMLLIACLLIGAEMGWPNRFDGLLSSVLFILGGAIFAVALHNLQVVT